MREKIKTKRFFMIATLCGTIKSINESTIILEQSGIGFEIFVATPFSFSLNQEITLQTYLHWHQEHGPTLYGFNSALEKTVFLLITSCSGIGPKIGLAILHQLEPTIFLQAIVEENLETLSSISGIGTKKAEQICVSLKHKVIKMLKHEPSLTATATPLTTWKDLTDTLHSLGYSNAEIKSVTTFLKETHVDAQTPFSTILRKSLAFLTKK